MNFGVRGAAPSHPEQRPARTDVGVLLKTLLHGVNRPPIRFIELAANMNVDPTNELLWRANRRRLDAESLRDSAHQNTRTSPALET